MDDDEATLSSLKQNLESCFEVATAMSGYQALDQLAVQECDLVITDYKMPDMDGLQLLDTARQRYPLTNFILITGHSDPELAEEARKLGAFDYLIKPLPSKDVIKAAERAIANSRQSREMLQPKDRKNYGPEIRTMVEERAKGLFKDRIGKNDDDRWYMAEEEILKKSILLLVSDRKAVVFPLEHTLMDEFNLVTIGEEEKARKKLAREPYDLLIADVQYSEKAQAIRRVEFLEEVRRIQIPIIAVTTDETVTSLEVLLKGIYDGFSKPPFDDIKNVCLEALKKYRERDSEEIKAETEKRKGSRMLSSVVGAQDSDMEETIKLSKIIAALMDGNVDYADNALDELTQCKKYTPIYLLATHKLIDLSPRSDLSEEQMRKALGLEKEFPWMAKFFGDKTTNCKIEYEVFDHYEKRNERGKNARIVLAQNEESLKNRKWDSEAVDRAKLLDFSNKSLREVAYCSRLPIVGIPERFPIAGGKRMKRYMLIQRIGGIEEFLPGKEDRSFTARNIDVLLEGEDQYLARQARLFIKFKENEFLADLQENPILFPEPLRHVVSVCENFEEDLTTAMKHYGLSEEIEKARYCCSLLQEVASHRYSQVRDASWRNMMFRRPLETNVKTIDDLIVFLKTRYISEGNYSLKSTINNNLVQIDFDKLNRLSLETEDVRRTDLGQDQLVADYHFVLNHIKFAALNLFRDGQDKYWDLVFDVNHLIEVVESIDVKKDDIYLDILQQARSFIDANSDSAVFPYESFEQWKEEADYVGVVYRCTHRMLRTIDKKIPVDESYSADLGNDARRIQEVLNDLIEYEKKKYEKEGIVVPESVIMAGTYEAVELRLEYFGNEISGMQVESDKSYSRLVKLEYLRAIYEKIENESYS